KEKPISSCLSKSESIFNSDSNFNDDNKNNDSSSVLKSNNNDNNSNSNDNPEQYIALPDFFKKQKLKWFSNNMKSIIPEQIHDTDAEFNLRYPRKDAIKLEPHSWTCINLKVVLEILATTMIQLTSRFSLAKKGINIKKGIIDTKYIEILQNDSEKKNIIEPNKKIAQAIFLSLVKIAQRMLFALTKTIETDKLGKSRLTLKNAA
ncbi:hypothetical protein G9A89_000636, partial [Geosiphon pyriformis]